MKSVILVDKCLFHTDVSECILDGSRADVLIAVNHEYQLFTIIFPGFKLGDEIFEKGFPGASIVIMFIIVSLVL